MAAILSLPQCVNIVIYNSVHEHDCNHMADPMPVENPGG